MLPRHDGRWPQHLLAEDCKHFAETLRPSEPSGSASGATALVCVCTTTWHAPKLVFPKRCLDRLHRLPTCHYRFWPSGTHPSTCNNSFGALPPPRSPGCRAVAQVGWPWHTDAWGGTKTSSAGSTLTATRALFCARRDATPEPKGHERREAHVPLRCLASCVLQARTCSESVACAHTAPLKSKRAVRKMNERKGMASTNALGA